MSDYSGQPGTNRPAWTIESTHPDLFEPAKASLSEVIDPEIGLNIIQLGLVRDIIIGEDNENAVVKMILTTPFCPYGPAMIESTRQKAEEGLNMEVHVDLGMEMWDFSMMEEGLGGDWGLF
jgi:metal-sulfur cluster biosynthetic enzyme